MSAPPARPMPAGRPLAYAGPRTSQVEGSRPLGGCDINWVMKLRNASQLMVMVIGVNFLNTWFGPTPLEGAVKALAALLSFAGAWLLTAPGPGAPGSESWVS